MGFFDDLTLGRYVPGNSPLHRLDPRIKLLALPLLMPAVFAGADWSRLALLALIAGLLLAVSGLSPRLWWRGVWAFRWFFLFTLALHLFFSPGRTLWGIAWLSQDGLLRGSLVCLQLTLALLFSSLLSLTTSPAQLTAAIAALLRPLERLGLPVRGFAAGLAGAWQFLPLLREEAQGQMQRARQQADPGRGSLDERLRTVVGLLTPLLYRLIDRAEEMARAEARLEKAAEEPLETLPPFRPALLFALVATAGGAALLCLWL